MTAYIHWVSFTITYTDNFNGKKSPISETNRDAYIPVVWKNELEKDDALALAIQRWIACYDEKSIFDSERYDQFFGTLTITDVQCTGMEVIKMEGNDLLDIIKKSPNICRYRI